MQMINAESWANLHELSPNETTSQTVSQLFQLHGAREDVTNDVQLSGICTVRIHFGFGWIRDVCL